MNIIEKKVWYGCSSCALHECFVADVVENEEKKDETQTETGITKRPYFKTLLIQTIPFEQNTSVRCVVCMLEKRINPQ